MSSPTRQLFGTDGIRGVAGEFPLTTQSTFMIGRALGHDLLRTNPKARVVIGQDTRESSGWIADRVALGLASCNVESHSAGVITTPGIAYLARSRKFDAGVVISASHNPWTDNGIKVFSGNGFKLPDSHELGIEQEIFSLLQRPELFRACRMQATFVHASPDGKNINEGCGALHPETVAKRIAEAQGAFDLGVTFDGDADRALFSDASGRVINGDAVLLLA